MCGVAVGKWLSADEVEKGAHEDLGFTLSSRSYAPGRMRQRA